jgi:hypothetical protein
MPELDGAALGIEDQAILHDAVDRHRRAVDLRHDAEAPRECAGQPLQLGLVSAQRVPRLDRRDRRLAGEVVRLVLFLDLDLEVGLDAREPLDGLLEGVVGRAPDHLAGGQRVAVERERLGAAPPAEAAPEAGPADLPRVVEGVVADANVDVELAGVVRAFVRQGAERRGDAVARLVVDGVLDEVRFLIVRADELVHRQFQFGGERLEQRVPVGRPRRAARGAAQRDRDGAGQKQVSHAGIPLFAGEKGAVHRSSDCTSPRGPREETAAASASAGRSARRRARGQSCGPSASSAGCGGGR